MRKRLFIFSLLAMLVASTSFFAATTTYETDAAHSNVGFSIPIAGGLSHVRGKFNDFKVTIVYDDKDISKSSVDAVIKATSIDTGIERRDAHLAPITGIFAAQEIKPQARVLAEDRGIRCLVLDYDDM